MSAAEWFDGAEALPPKIDLESVYEGEEPTEVPASSKPASRVPSSTTMVSQTKPQQPEPAPAPKKDPIPEPKEPAPQPMTFREPPPSIKDQGSSIAKLASKYDDQEDSSSDENDDSSFEEVAKPVERHAPNKHITETAAITREASSPFSPTKLASPVESSKPASTAPPPMTGLAVSSVPVGSGGKGDQDGGEEVTLKDIKAILESQSRTIGGQTEKIVALTAEVDRLKRAVGEKM
ncbi:MAG: hypothetical protein Q9183_007808 [Haloplaca sp. 2 TL-2023]